jgi:hypothetical protein
MDAYRLQNDNGETVQAFLLNAHGMELFMRGNVDTTTLPSATAVRNYNAILESRNRTRTLSNGIDLKERNSTIDVDVIDFATDAKTIGVYMDSSGFIATAYDSHGVRITDVFIQEFEPGDRDWKMRVIQDQSEYPIKQNDLEPALRLAQLLNVREDKIFYDDKLGSDIWDCESFDYAGRVHLDPYLAKSKVLDSARRFPSR